MSKIIPHVLVNSMTGKTNFKSDTSFRMRNGKLHSYTIQNPYEGPASEKQQQGRKDLGSASKQCKIDRNDPVRLAFWTERFEQYKKAADKSVENANRMFLNKTHKRRYNEQYGFIVASLRAGISFESQNPAENA